MNDRQRCRYIVSQYLHAATVSTHQRPEKNQPPCRPFMFSATPFQLLKCISPFSYHCDVERREIHLTNESVTSNISVLNRRKHSSPSYVTPQRESGILKPIFRTRAQWRYPLTSWRLRESCNRSILGCRSKFAQVTRPRLLLLFTFSQFPFKPQVMN